MYKTGNVRKLNRTLSPEEYQRSCCALKHVKECVTSSFEEFCTLYEGALPTLTKNLKFYLNALQLFECDESACNGSLVNFGNVWAFSFLVLVLRLVA